MTHIYSMLNVAANYVMVYDNLAKRVRYLSYQKGVGGVVPKIARWSDMPPADAAAPVDQSLIDIVFESPKVASPVKSLKDIRLSATTEMI